MSRTSCGICGPGVNTFIIDQVGSFCIRLCLICAKEQLFRIDFSKISKCSECGELFTKIKSDICPVCWESYFKIKNGGN